MTSRVALYAGIDWSARWLDCALVRRDGRFVDHHRIVYAESHDPVATYLEWLRSHNRTHWKRIPTAIEDVGILIAQALVDNGMTVVHIDPTRAARARKASTRNNTKSDRADARLLADMLRAGGWRPYTPPAPQARALGILARAHAAAVGNRTRVLHRMRAQLSTYYPAAVTVWQRVGLGHPQARAVLRLAPTPYAAAQLTRAQLAIALRAGGRWRTVDDEAERLHLAFCRATLTTHPDVEAARGVELLGLLDDLDQAVGRIDALASEVARCFAEHPHQPIVRSLPGVGPILGARLLGEIGSIARFPDARALCAYAGVTPVTWGSGTVVRVRARRSANSHLRETMHQVALCALHRSAGARACYTAARQRGMDHRPALRTVATRLLRCAYHCLTRGELYEEDLAWRPTRATEDCLPAPRSPWGE